MPAKHPLRRYREKHGLSQEALGKELGVTGMTIYRWEAGERLPRRGHWEKIEEVTGIPATALLPFARMSAGAAA